MPLTTTNVLDQQVRTTEDRFVSVQVKHVDVVVSSRTDLHDDVVGVTSLWALYVDETKYIAEWVAHKMTPRVLGN